MGNRGQSVIIVGIYPETIQSEGDDAESISSLRKTFEFVTEIVPQECAIHVLPPYPSDGDFGFAPSSLTSVDPNFGTLDDLLDFCQHYDCVFDGIYNHVGNTHPWVTNFKENTQEYGKYLHAYYFEAEPKGPMSPRGQPALQPVGEEAPNWYFYRTFTDSAVDVRLEAQEVKRDVKDHAKFLEKIGAWAVRLDAVAYYKKNLSGDIRHNPGVHEIAEEIASIAKGQGLELFAQINRDSEGLSYYGKEEFRSIAINDFTFTTYLAISLLTSSPAPLVEYDGRCVDERICVRAPRTHDGILLRSKAMLDQDRHTLISTIESLGFLVRFEGDSPYELNVSLPKLLSRAFPVTGAKALELSFVITAMSSGVAYFFLPALLGYVPEDDIGAKYRTSNDPRALNRSPIPEANIKEKKMRRVTKRTRSLLEKLSDLRQQEAADVWSFKSKMFAEGDGMLRIETITGRFKLFANLTEHPLRIPEQSRELTEVLASRSGARMLEQHDYCLLRDTSMLE